MADRANDDGTGVWMSKGRIADEIEASRRAVITAIQGMVADGILIDNGVINNRSTHDYTLVIREIKRLPTSKCPPEEGVQICTPDSDLGVKICTGGVNHVHRGCEPRSHEPSFNRQLTLGASQEKSESAADKRPRPNEVGGPLSADARAAISAIGRNAEKGTNAANVKFMDRLRRAVCGFDGKTFTLKENPEIPGKIMARIWAEAEELGYTFETEGTGE